MKREMTLTIDSDSANEAFARTVVAAYVTRLDPTLEELADIKTAVSEAVTNSIIHGYGGRRGRDYDRLQDLRQTDRSYCAR